MSVSVASWCWMIDMAETQAEVDRVLYDAEEQDEPLPRWALDTVRAAGESRKVTLAHLGRRRVD